jgi:excisionase family DNA binding protein
MLSWRTLGMDRLISIDETAELLSVSPWTVRAWITQGKLGSAKLGSRRLVPQSEIERLIASASIPPLPEHIEQASARR